MEIQCWFFTLGNLRKRLFHFWRFSPSSILSFHFNLLYAQIYGMFWILYWNCHKFFFFLFNLTCSSYLQLFKSSQIKAAVIIVFRCFWRILSTSVWVVKGYKYKNVLDGSSYGFLKCLKILLWWLVWQCCWKADTWDIVLGLGFFFAQCLLARNLYASVKTLCPIFVLHWLNTGPLG